VRLTSLTSLLTGVNPVQADACPVILTLRQPDLARLTPRNFPMMSNPRVFNAIYAPVQRLTAEQFFSKVHSLITKVSVQDFLWKDEHTTVQSFAEPRMMVNPLAASFDEESAPVDASLKAYMAECKERGRSVYILAWH
jgi:hypothetical protein